MILVTHIFRKFNYLKMSEFVNTCLLHIAQLKHLAKKCLISRKCEQMEYHYLRKVHCLVVSLQEHI